MATTLRHMRRRFVKLPHLNSYIGKKVTQIVKKLGVYLKLIEF